VALVRRVEIRFELRDVALRLLPLVLAVPATRERKCCADGDQQQANA
jgi:hypothetical protein